MILHRNVSLSCDKPTNASQIELVICNQWPYMTAWWSFKHQHGYEKQSFVTSKTN
jgi:hypothetical protein